MKIGIVGTGKISEKHILAYKSLGYDDIAIYDINSILAEEVARRFNIIHVNEMNELISSCEVVDVCTPVTTHKNIILKSLEYRKHVFCEKPLCQNLDEADEIKEAAQNAGKVVMVGYLYRFHPAVQQVKKWLDANIIGSVNFGLFRIGGRGNHKKWKHIKELGGGCINEMLIHKLDLIYFLLGKIDRLRILFNTILLKTRVIDEERFEPNAEDNILLQLKVGNTLTICQADFTSPSYMEYFELQGDNGSIFASILGYFPTLLFLQKPLGVYNQGNNFFNFNQVNLFELELRHFLTCIQHEENNNINSVDDSIELMKIVEQIKRRSNDTNSEIGN